MKIQQCLVVLGTAALCGFALAQTPKAQPTAAERLEALEQEVQTLRGQLAAATTATNSESAVVKKQAAEALALANQSAIWALGQAEGAAELARVLDDSEQKGFTFGINPESRVALLAGWRDFAAAIQKDVPKPLVTNEKLAAQGTQVPAPKKP